jgi:phosphate transport system permease protein
MRLMTLFIVLAFLTIAAFLAGRRQAVSLVGGYQAIRNLHSLPDYYGYRSALCAALPALLAVVIWLAANDTLIMARVAASLPAPYDVLTGPQLGLVLNDVRGIAAGAATMSQQQSDLQGTAALLVELQESSRWVLSMVAIGLCLAGGLIGHRTIQPQLRARNQVEYVLKLVLIAASTVAIFTTIGILLSVAFEAFLFFRQVSLLDFLFGLEWSPQTAIRADQVGSSGAFGAVPLFAGTLLISGIAMAVAAPLGLMIAIYLSEYAAQRVRAVVKPALEVLAGIPTVVYGYFAALTMAPLLRQAGESLGLSVASESALGAGLVMGVMIIPFVSSLSDDVINAVPQSLRDGSLALGATRSETIKRVVFPAALPGIVGALLLAVSRAIGETMIVVMAAGLSANLTANPLEAVTTVTVQIVTLLVGDQEFDSPKTLAAFALGLLLFIVTLALNVVALRVVRRYREQYE